MSPTSFWPCCQPPLCQHLYSRLFKQIKAFRKIHNVFLSNRIQFNISIIQKQLLTTNANKELLLLREESQSKLPFATHIAMYFYVKEDIQQEKRTLFTGN